MRVWGQGWDSSVQSLLIHIFMQCRIAYDTNEMYSGKIMKILVFFSGFFQALDTLGEHIRASFWDVAECFFADVHFSGVT